MTLFFSFSSFFKKQTPIHVFERQCIREGTDGDKARKIFHLLLHSPNGLNEQVGASGEAGARNCIQVPTVGGRGPCTQTTACCIPRGISRKLNQRWSSRDWKVLLDVG